MAAIDRLGARKSWGVHQIDVDGYALNIPVFVEALLPRALAAMEEILTIAPGVIARRRSWSDRHSRSNGSRALSSIERTKLGAPETRCR